ncbi:hypothetical protein [Kitasatospora sp. NPDC051702]|uniref:hypothetical protein n=1 Tax=Kitasatospora sp. NPDC051702 TaxID=3155672 RepID=UPI003418D024
MPVSKSASRLSAGVLAAACLTAVVTATAPAAHADSVLSTYYAASSTGSIGNGAAPGGQVTRGQVLTRAQAWVNQAVPYSTNGLTAPYSWWSDGQTGGRYRQDCSGFVSMAWQLPESPNTLGLPSYSTSIGKWDLQPGDILNSSEHVVIFAGWRDKNAGTFNYYQESSRSRPTNFNTDGNLNGSSLSSHPMSSYTALRYKNIVDSPSVSGSGSTVAASATGNGVHLNIIGSDGGMWATEGDYAAGNWTGAWSPLGGSGLKALTSVTIGTSMHVYALGSTGRVYSMDADYTTGQWSGTWVEVPGGAAGATALTATATGNTVHLNILGADGALYNTDGDYTTGHWTGAWNRIGGSALQALTSVTIGNVVHLYAIGSTGHVYSMDADYTAGRWTDAWVEVPGGAAGATALTATATGNTVHLNILGADGALYNTDGDYTTGHWTGSWNRIGGSALKALTSTLTGNTVHLYAIGATGTVYTMDADYTAGRWSNAWAEIPGGAIAAH